MSKLYLIGVSHFDLNAYLRLNNMFNSIKPEWVGIEETERDFKEATIWTDYLSNPNNFKDAIQKFKDKYPSANKDTLELWLSAFRDGPVSVINYCLKNNARLLYCNSTELMSQVDFDTEVKTKEKGISVLEQFLKLPLSEAFVDVEKEYNKEFQPVSDSINLTRFYQGRDKFTEQKLRTQFNYCEGTGAYICGLDYLYGDYSPNLFNLLSDINVSRHRLNEFD